MKRYSAGLLSILALAISGAVPASGQFGSWRDKLKDATKNSPLGSLTGGSPLTQAGDMASYLTIATDQGMKALDELAAAFPENKVAAFKQLSAQYNEAKTSRKDGNIDADSFTTASKAAAEMAKLEDDWKSYKKQGAKGVRKADARLALMLIADGEASSKAPKTVRGLQAEMKVAAAKKQIDKLDQLKSSAAFLNCVTEQVPSQTQSFTTVRHIAKNIADAEHYQLSPDPSPESLSSTTTMKIAAQKIDADIPPEG